MKDDSPSKFLIYALPNSKGAIDAIIEDETIWASQKSMAILFETTPQNITQHLKNISEEGELEADRTCKEFLQVQVEGDRQVKRTSRE